MCVILRIFDVLKFQLEYYHRRVYNTSYVITLRYLPFIVSAVFVLYTLTVAIDIHSDGKREG